MPRFREPGLPIGGDAAKAPDGAADFESLLVAGQMRAPEVVELAAHPLARSRRHDPVEGRPMANDFPAIPLPENRPYDRIREFYLYLEPTLMATIARGDRAEAVRLINYILVHIYAAGMERSDLLKGLLLELVVMMSRAAVEAGSPQSEVLGFNYQALTSLASIEGDEQMARWLRETLERIFEAIERQEVGPPRAITAAVRYIRENAHREVTRDETAASVGISPSHFSHLLRERTGLSFTQLLRQARVDLACELLRTTDEPLVMIAHRCGFYDQSHFSRVFGQVKSMTPRQYRAAFGSDEPPGR